MGLGFVSRTTASSETEPATQNDLPVVEPKAWRGEYVSPSERQGNSAQRRRNRQERDPDPYAPDNNPELWARLVVVDDKGRPMFPPQALHDSMKVRYADRDPMLDLGIDIWNGMHPQPIMTVNRKVYPVTLEENGWRTFAVVYANVDQREYEKEWFDALQGQTVTLYREPGYPVGVSNYETLEVEKATFGKVQTMVVQENGNIAYSMDYEGRAACKTLIGSERRKNTQTGNDVRARQLARF